VINKTSLFVMPADAGLMYVVFTHLGLLTRQLNSLPSAEACQPAARHQNAAVVPLQPVLITQTAGWHASACPFKFNLLGASSLPLLCVAALEKGTTLLCEQRLDQGQA
jgi:hypothetical protein